MSANFSLLRRGDATTGQDGAVIGFTTVRVVGPSMEPTVRNGEIHLVRRGGRIRVGDIVVIRHPQRPELFSVKRVIRRECPGWWVEGDNPAASSDSREFGAVPDELIVGRLVLRLRSARRG